MKKALILAPLVFIFGCAHNPKCSSTESYKSIYFEHSSCKVRIRQVVLVSDLRLSSKVNTSELSQYQLEWVAESTSKTEISEGHYKLVKQNQKNKEDQDGE